MRNENATLPSRHYAHPFDRPVKSDSATHGVGRNSDAIGGYNGIGWYETFRDRLTGKLYRVHCSDGVYGGKNAHSDKNLEWMQLCQHDIMMRTKQAAERRNIPIRISPEEWAIMLNRIFEGWLDKIDGEKYGTVGDANRHRDCGVIGTIKNVSVVVDPNESCPLGMPPCKA